MGWGRGPGRFQKSAEDIRYGFVQGLNRAHIDHLSYQDDINRNKDEESWQRARVDSDNWQVLQKYQFRPASATSRINNASQSIFTMLAWLLVGLSGLWWCSRRIKL